MKCSYYFWPENQIAWSDCSGANAKRTLVLSSDTEMRGNLSFLKKILRAVDLDFDKDIHFMSAPVNLQIQLMSDSHLTQYSKLVLFGIRPSQIGIWSGDKVGCHVLSFESLVCVVAPALQDIERQPEYKKVLWSALKQVFQKQD